MVCTLSLSFRLQAKATLYRSSQRRIYEVEEVIEVKILNLILNLVALTMVDD